MRIVDLHAVADAVVAEYVDLEDAGDELTMTMKNLSVILKLI